MGRLSDFQLHLANSKAKPKTASKDKTFFGTSQQLARSILADSQPDSNVLDLYSDSPKTISQSAVKPPRTPVTKTYNTARTPKVTAVDISSPKPSPILVEKVSSTTSQKYDARQDSGSTVKDFGNLDLKVGSENDEFDENAKRPKFCERVELDITAIKYPRTMSTDPSTQQSALYNELTNLGDAMQDLHGFDVSQLSFTSTDDVVGLGRIVCDGDGKMNPKSILLQTPTGDYLTLEVDNCPNYALFPGQIVAVRGTNPGGGRVYVKEIFHGANAAPVVIEPPEDSGAMSMLMASGPFIPNDGVSLQPFQDLIKTVRTLRPNVLVLSGPFLDTRNEKLIQMEEPLSQLFEGMMLTLSNLANDLSMETVILPSPREITHIGAYPIRPFSITKFDVSKKLHFMTDPCMFSVNGLVFGVSATDCVFHVSFQECSKQTGQKDTMDRISRLVSHFLRQQSFYPLYPAHNDVSLDVDLLPLAQMSVQPHVLIIPSELSPYVKMVDGCLAVNPGSVTKGQSAGTYGFLQIDLEKVRNQSVVSEQEVSCKVIKM